MTAKKIKVCDKLLINDVYYTVVSVTGNTMIYVRDTDPMVKRGASINSIKPSSVTIWEPDPNFKGEST